MADALKVYRMEGVAAERIRDLRDNWLYALEQDKGNPSYTVDNERFEWSDWRLKTMLAIQVASVALGEADPAGMPTIKVDEPLVVDAAEAR